MYDNILVGLDGSPHGLAAMRAAVELARSRSAELHVLTVTRPYKVSPDLKRFLEAENLLGEPKYVFDEMTENILEEAGDVAAGSGVTMHRVIREGKPARTLIDYAKSHKVDLIVVGSRGVGELEAALLGSVSQKVSMLAPCAVLIVR